MTRAQEILVQLSQLLSEYKVIIESQPSHPQQQEVLEEFLFVARNLAQLHGFAVRDIGAWRSNLLNNSVVLRGSAINPYATLLTNNLIVMGNNYKGIKILDQPDKFEL